MIKSGVRNHPQNRYLDKQNEVQPASISRCLPLLVATFLSPKPLAKYFPRYTPVQTSCRPFFEVRRGCTAARRSPCPDYSCRRHHQEKALQAQAIRYPPLLPPTTAVFRARTPARLTNTRRRQSSSRIHLQSGWGWKRTNKTVTKYFRFPSLCRCFCLGRPKSRQ